MIVRWSLLFLLFVGIAPLFAQDEVGGEQWEVNYPTSIMDNSFLIEEAFNQEAGVVQHISNVQYVPTPDKLFGFAFTQEWPLWGMTHQLSYQIGYTNLGTSSAKGLGDIMVNYRYQLLGMESGVAFAPRFSFFLPTGDVAKELGMGVVGYEVGLPASRRFSTHVVVHANLTMTLFPNAKGFDGAGNEVRHTLPAYTVGTNIVWLAEPNLNLMVELLHRWVTEFDENGVAKNHSESIVNPAVRFALNYENLQIVPGFSVPVRMFNDRTEVGLLGYLSFEHSF